MDSKIRFQKQTFQRKLDEARGYKRHPKKLPEGKWEAFLERVKLNSTKNRLVLLFFFILALVFIYAPTPFTVKNIKISGLGPEEEVMAKADVINFIKKPRVYFQQNLSLLSRGRLRDSLEQRPEILRVLEISKNYPNTLEINVEPRLPMYLLQTPNGFFVLSNDGRVVTETAPDAINATSSPLAALTQIQVTGEKNKLNAGDNYLTADLLAAITEIKNKLPQVLGSPIKTLALASRAETDTKAELEAGYAVYFDYKSDLSVWWPKLSILLENLNEQDKAKLYYIDLRLQNRAYVCYKGTACARVKLPTVPAAPDGNATATPIN